MAECIFILGCALGHTPQLYGAQRDKMVESLRLGLMRNDPELGELKRVVELIINAYHPSNIQVGSVDELFNGAVCISDKKEPTK
jgi:hypothetical protein